MRSLTLFRMMVGLTLAITPVALAKSALAEDGDSSAQGGNSATDGGAASQPDPTQDPYAMHDSGQPSPGALEELNQGDGQTRV